jgi:hypothetical protein
MIRGATVVTSVQSGLFAACGIPVDSQYFDDSSVQPLPEIGQEFVLAHFDLPAQYCGVLQYFSQFTDTFGDNAANIATPSIEWKIVVNGHALFPYINLRHIVNPWGYGSYPVNIRLDGNSTVELVARGVKNDGTLKDVEIGPDGEVRKIRFVGGRIVGRFWYNSSYGDVT